MNELLLRINTDGSLRCTSLAPAQTTALATRLAALLTGGEVLCFSGDLGAGKTLFVQGLAAALGIKEHVTSPTFALLNIYQGKKLALYHFDLYRLESEDELENIGFYEYTEPEDGVTVIEWSELFPDCLPEERLELALERGAAEEERTITLRARGNRAEKILQELSKA